MGASDTPAGPGERREDFATALADPRRDRERILELWRTGLAQIGQPEAKFDWYYLRNPVEVPPVLLLRAGAAESPVGVASVGPRRMRLDDQALVAGALIDFVVAPEQRSFFPALFLQRQVRREGLARYALLFGLPNAQSAAIVRRAGYKRIGESVRSVRVLRSSAYLSRHMPAPLAAIAGAAVDRVRMAWASWRARAGGAYAMGATERPDALFDGLWERASRPGVMMGVRDAHFLAWRFRECPFGPYEFLTLQERATRQLAAYAVVHVSGDTMLVADFLVDPAMPGAELQLWMELSRNAYRRGLRSLSVEFLGPAAVRAQMEAAGLVGRERRELYAAVEGREGLGDPERWYLTLADEDV